MKRIISACLMATLVSLLGCSQPTRTENDARLGRRVIRRQARRGRLDHLRLSRGTPPAQAPIKAGHYDLPAEAGPIAEKTYTVRINALAKTGKTVPNIMGDGAPTMD